MKRSAVRGLLTAAAVMGVAVTPDQAAVLVELLERMLAQPQNLTAIRDLEEGVDRHLADSLAGLLTSALRGPEVVDLGSGGGFPGLVLAVMRPELHVTLVESERRKAEWLTAASAALPNVRVVADRSEHLARDARGAYQTVTARAVAPLVPTLELAAPLIDETGALIVWSTPIDADQDARAAAASAELGLLPEPPLPVSPFPGADRLLRVFRRVAPTPARYPRRPGRAAARPIA